MAGFPLIAADENVALQPGHASNVTNDGGEGEIPFPACDVGMTGGPRKLVFERDHGLAVTAEGGYAAQIALLVGHQ
jgi:hypothetical protein